MVRLLLALCVCIQEAVLDHAMPETGALRGSTLALQSSDMIV